MKVTDAAIRLIKHHEGVRYKPYRDVAQLWTVGVGHLMYPDQLKLDRAGRLEYQLHPNDQRTFLKEEVDELLRSDLHRFESGVTRLCPVRLTQGQFNALVSFSFNVGLGALQRSTLRQKVNRQEWERCTECFLKYNKVGGVVFRGLVRRRRDEVAMFLMG